MLREKKCLYWLNNVRKFVYNENKQFPVLAGIYKQIVRNDGYSKHFFKEFVYFKHTPVANIV